MTTKENGSQRTRSKYTSIYEIYLFKNNFDIDFKRRSREDYQHRTYKAITYLGSDTKDTASH